MGGVNYSRILPPGSFINAGDFDNPEHLSSYLFSLLRNETLFESYFSWRPYYNIHSYMSIPDNCDLCNQLVSGHLKEKKVYKDMFKWLVKVNSCNSRSYNMHFEFYFQLRMQSAFIQILSFG